MHRRRRPARARTLWPPHTFFSVRRRHKSKRPPLHLSCQPLAVACTRRRPALGRHTFFKPFFLVGDGRERARAFWHFPSAIPPPAQSHASPTTCVCYVCVFVRQRVMMTATRTPLRAAATHAGVIAPPAICRRRAPLWAACARRSHHCTPSLPHSLPVSALQSTAGRRAVKTAAFAAAGSWSSLEKNTAPPHLPPWTTKRGSGSCACCLPHS